MPITIVLYQTENPENLGSIARAASNFDFNDIILLDPRCNVEAKSRWLAKHGLETLEKMRVVKGSSEQETEKLTAETLRGFDTIVATQGKNSTGYNLVRAPLTPRDVTTRLMEIDVATHNVAILFGPEGEGLPIDILRHADIILAIPTSRDNPSMNLSQSVVVVLYELSLMRGKENKITLPYRPMNRQEHDALLKLIDRTLDTMHFKNPKQKETQQLVWRRMVGRSFLTKRECYAVMGYLKNVYYGKPESGTNSEDINDECPDLEDAPESLD